MMTEQLEDAEVIAALGAFQPYRTVVWPLASKLDMRRALDAAAALAPIPEKETTDERSKTHPR